MSVQGPVSRDGLFKTLKAICVPILKLGVRPPTPDTGRVLIPLVESLLATLKAPSSILDEKLAEYVLIPLSHLFRQPGEHPVRLVELSVASIRVLVEKGWKSKLSSEHARQLFILLIFLLDTHKPVPAQPTKPGKPNQSAKPPKPLQPPQPINEELQAEVLLALSDVLRALGESPTASSLAMDPAFLPSLGHGLVTILDVVTSDAPPTSQLHALDAVDSLYSSLHDHETLANFFPGTASTLTRLLSIPLSKGQKSRVLVRGIVVFQVVVAKVLGDVRTRRLFELDRKSSTSGAPAKRAKGKINWAWVQATVSQIKTALSSILKLRSHDSGDVRCAIRKLCLTLLDECHHSLSPCSPLLVETAMTLLDLEGPDPDINLEALAQIFPETGEEVKSVFYGWVSSTPRLIQHADTDTREQAMRNLFAGIKLLENLRLDSPTVLDSFLLTLRDALSTMLRPSTTAPIVLDETDSLSDTWTGTALVTAQTPQSSTFRPVVLSGEGDSKLHSQMVELLGRIGTQSQQTSLANKMLSLLQDSTSFDRVSAYWLTLELLKSSVQATEQQDLSNLDSLLDFSSHTSDPLDTSCDQQIQELYQYSVDALVTISDSQSSDLSDPKVAAIAMEAITFVASRMGTTFRPELMDILYPISTFMGSSSPILRSHAITTLSALAKYCDYSTVADLIVDNVDYMVNTVALRLNALDISPSTMQVLRMMVKLAGPRLVPFLDDVVDAIFGALENYHGYPLLVSGLFSVLREVAEQGSQAGTASLITYPDKAPPSHRKTRRKETSIDDIADLLRKQRKRAERDEELYAEEDGEGIKGHPKEPWKRSQQPEDDNPENDLPQDDDALPPEEPEIPPTKTYTLLTRILRLTQHYLTSPSPVLRKSLLDLLSSVSPSLAADENQFLPLVNDIWPVTLERLWDPEPYVAEAACGALAILCESAGDFLSSRFRTEWDEELATWFYKARYGEGIKVGKDEQARVVFAMECTTNNSLTKTKTRGTTGGSLARHDPYSPTPQCWTGAKKLLIALVLHVRVSDEMFREICWLLADEMEKDPEVLEALETIDEIMVWLVRHKLGRVENMPMPVFEGVEFAPL